MPASGGAEGKTTLTLAEAAAVAAICFGVFILCSIHAVAAGFPAAEFSDAGNIWAVSAEAVLAAAALLFLRTRRFDIRTLYPEPTLKGTLLGGGLFLVCYLIGGLTIALFRDQAQSGLVVFSFARVSPTGAILLAMVNGTFEEVFLLGALVRGLRGYGLSVALGVPLLVRMLYHLYQGPAGVAWILTFGIVLSLAYVVNGRLWPPVFAHILCDIVPML